MAALRKENNELKARKGQMGSQVGSIWAHNYTLLLSVNLGIDGPSNVRAVQTFASKVERARVLRVVSQTETDRTLHSFLERHTIPTSLTHALLRYCTTDQDATEEVEKAHKCCREYQFRIKQLQEQCTFLEKLKKTEASSANKRDGGPDTIASTTDSLSKETDDDIPVWMK